MKVKFIKSSNWSSALVETEELLTQVIALYVYDKHGNITNLIRNGRTGTSTFGTIDNLSMSYAGNQLIKADDAGINVILSASMDFKNNSTAAKEYFYDSNGNLTRDLNKGINSALRIIY